MHAFPACHMAGNVPMARSQRTMLLCMNKALMVEIYKEEKKNLNILKTKQFSKQMQI